MQVFTCNNRARVHNARMMTEMHNKNAPLAFRLAGRFYVRKRGGVAYCTELTPRPVFNLRVAYFGQYPRAVLACFRPKWPKLKSEWPNFCC